MWLKHLHSLQAMENPSKIRASTTSAFAFVTTVAVSAIACVASAIAFVATVIAAVAAIISAAATVIADVTAVVSAVAAEITAGINPDTVVAAVIKTVIASDSTQSDDTIYSDEKTVVSVKALAVNASDMGVCNHPECIFCLSVNSIKTGDAVGIIQCGFYKDTRYCREYQDFILY